VAQISAATAVRIVPVSHARMLIAGAIYRLEKIVTKKL